MKLTQSCVSLSMAFLLLSGTTGLESCNTKEQTPAPVVQQESTNTAAQDPSLQQTSAASGGQSAQADQGQPPQVQLPAVNLSADGLDELLGPIALYPTLCWRSLTGLGRSSRCDEWRKLAGPGSEPEFERRGAGSGFQQSRLYPCGADRIRGPLLAWEHGEPGALRHVDVWPARDALSHLRRRHRCGGDTAMASRGRSRLSILLVRALRKERQSLETNT